MANYTSIHSGPHGRCSLCSPACDVTAEERGGPVPGPSPSLPSQGWHGPGAGGTFVQQTDFGTSHWSSLLQNAPQLMEWDTTVTTWPSKAPLNSPAVLPCVTYGSEGWPTTAISSLYLKPLICVVVKYYILSGLDFLFYSPSALITASQSTLRSSHVALQVADSP